MISTLLFLVIATSTSSLALPAQAAQSAPSLSLKEAIRHALAHSPVLKASESELSIQKLEEKDSFSRFFPSLDLSTKAGLQDGSNSTRTTPWVSQLDLTFTGTLYDNGETFTRNRIASLKRAEAELKRKMVRDQVCRDVAFAFLDYSLSQKKFQILTNKYALVQKQAQMVSAQYHQGLKTRKDFLRFNTELRSAELGLAEYQTRIETSKSKLEAVLGGNGKALLEAAAGEGVPKLEFVTYDPGKVNLAELPQHPPDLSRHYERQLADLKIAASGKNVDLARRRRWPELTLTAGAGYGSADYLATGTPFVTNDELNWNVLFNLKYNLWDWGIRRNELAAKLEEQNVQELGRETALLSLRSEVQQLMFQLANVRKTYQYSMELFELEKTSFDFLQTEYRNGRVPYLDLITGLDRLSAAEMGFTESNFTLQRLLIAYRYHQGTLYEEFCSP